MGYHFKVSGFNEVLQKLSAEAIVVGPPAMIKFSAAGLAETGFPEEHIWISQSRRMCFGGYTKSHRLHGARVCPFGKL